MGWFWNSRKNDGDEASHKNGSEMTPAEIEYTRTMMRRRANEREDRAEREATQALIDSSPFPKVPGRYNANHKHVQSRPMKTPPPALLENRAHPYAKSQAIGKPSRFAADDSDADSSRILARVDDYDHEDDQQTDASDAESMGDHEDMEVSGGAPQRSEYVVMCMCSMALVATIGLVALQR